MINKKMITLKRIIAVENVIVSMMGKKVVIHKEVIQKIVMKGHNIHKIMIPKLLLNIQMTVLTVPIITAKIKMLVLMIIINIIAET